MQNREFGLLPLYFVSFYRQLLLSDLLAFSRSQQRVDLIMHINDFEAQMVRYDTASIVLEIRSTVASGKNQQFRVATAARNR